MLQNTAFRWTSQLTLLHRRRCESLEERGWEICHAWLESYTIFPLIRNQQVPFLYCRYIDLTPTFFLLLVSSPSWPIRPSRRWRSDPLGFPIAARRLDCISFFFCQRVHLKFRQAFTFPSVYLPLDDFCFSEASLFCKCYGTDICIEATNIERISGQLWIRHKLPCTQFFIHWDIFIDMAMSPIFMA